jgi:hypothetical protein
MIKKSLAAILSLSVSLSSVCKAETPYYQEHRAFRFQKDDGIVLGANAVIGCAVGAIPSVVQGNKVKKILTDCSQGALGGALIYSGEKAASLSSTPGIGWLGHGLTSLGASIRENVAVGDGMLDRISYNLGPVKFTHGKKNARKDKNFNWHILPGSLIGIITNLANGHEFNANASLYTGNPVFESDSGTKNEGYALGNVTTIRRHFDYKRNDGRGYSKFHIPESKKTNTFNHEQVHANQYREFGSLEIALRQSEIYSSLSDTAHLALGPDLAVVSLFYLSTPLKERQKPMELVPYGLVKKN